MQIQIIGRIDHPNVGTPEIYDYYPKFMCDTPQATNFDEVTNSMTGDVSAIMIDGIWYLDYTSVINNTLGQKKQEFFDHRVKSFNEFFAENYTWYNIPGYDQYLSQIVMPEMIWFYNKVAPNKEWDLKVKGRWEEMFGKQITYYSQPFKFAYEGEVITSEDLGNITFGYWGSAMGFSEGTLHTGAWIVGEGDENDRDVQMVKKGIAKFFDEHGSKYPTTF